MDEVPEEHKSRTNETDSEVIVTHPYESSALGRLKPNDELARLKRELANAGIEAIENPNQSKCGNQCGNQCGDQHKEHGQWKESDERNVAVSCNVSHERLTSPVHVPHRRLLLALDSFVGLGKNVKCQMANQIRKQ